MCLRASIKRRHICRSADAKRKREIDESRQTAQISFMTLLYHSKFAGSSLLFPSRRVTFYSNLTDVQVMMPSASESTDLETAPAPYLRALIEMISILLSRLMTDELAAAGAFDKPLSAATSGTE